MLCKLAPSLVIQYGPGEFRRLSATDAEAGTSMFNLLNFGLPLTACTRVTPSSSSLSLMSGSEKDDIFSIPEEVLESLMGLAFAGRAIFVLFLQLFVSVPVSGP